VKLEGSAPKGPGPLFRPEIERSCDESISSHFKIELLEDLEFIISRGFRPLTFTKLFEIGSGLEENVIVCEKLTK
jgi:hypothetical protein